MDRSIVPRPRMLDFGDHVLTLNDLAKDDVLAVEERGGCSCDEEL